MNREINNQKLLTGLHILGEFHTNDLLSLKDLSLLKNKIIRAVEDAGLHQVGATEYSFPGGGFTYVILLAESHLSIHTWPELNYVTLDVFVCNVLEDNSSTARELFEVVVKLFNPQDLSQREVIR